MYVDLQIALAAEAKLTERQWLKEQLNSEVTRVPGVKTSVECAYNRGNISATVH
jgi:hypothetical protein